MDSSLLLLPLARQRLLQALALGIPAPALTESLFPVLACNPLLSFAAASADVPSSTADDSAGTSAEWSAKEDDLLKALIAEHGTSKWSRIAAKLGSKTNRQCRRRWQAIMNSMGSKGSWTAEEDAKLLEGHRRFGNRWTDIARLVPGRTDNAVKNRFAALAARGESVKSPKVKRWSDMCLLPKVDSGVPELLKARDAEDSCRSPSATSAASCTSSPKRKLDDFAAPSKRVRMEQTLDLNLTPEGADGWLSSESECSISLCSQSSSEEDCGFDLNSPACA